MHEEVHSSSWKSSAPPQGWKESVAPPNAPTDLSNEDLGFGRISSEVKRCFLLGLSLTLWRRITPEQFCCWSSQELEKPFIHAVMHSFLAYLSYFQPVRFYFCWAYSCNLTIRRFRSRTGCLDLHWTVTRKMIDRCAQGDVDSDHVWPGSSKILKI